MREIITGGEFSLEDLFKQIVSEFPNIDVLSAKEVLIHEKIHFDALKAINEFDTEFLKMVFKVDELNPELVKFFAFLKGKIEILFGSNIIPVKLHPELPFEKEVFSAFIAFKVNDSDSLSNDQLDQIYNVLNFITIINLILKSNKFSDGDVRVLNSIISRTVRSDKIMRFLLNTYRDTLIENKILFTQYSIDTSARIALGNENPYIVYAGELLSLEPSIEDLQIIRFKEFLKYKNELKSKLVKILLDGNPSNWISLIDREFDKFQNNFLINIKSDLYQISEKPTPEELSLKLKLVDSLILELSEFFKPIEDANLPEALMYYKDIALQLKELSESLESELIIPYTVSNLFKEPISLNSLSNIFSNTSEFFAVEVVDLMVNKLIKELIENSNEVGDWLNNDNYELIEAPISSPEWNDWINLPRNERSEKSPIIRKLTSKSLISFFRQLNVEKYDNLNFHMHLADYSYQNGLGRAEDTSNKTPIKEYYQLLSSEEGKKFLLRFIKAIDENIVVGGSENIEVTGTDSIFKLKAHKIARYFHKVFENPFASITDLPTGMSPTESEEFKHMIGYGAVEALEKLKNFRSLLERMIDQSAQN